MTSPARTPPPIPEAAGPGTPTPAGGILYGDAGAPGARVHIEPRMTAEERERNRAAYSGRCDRCAAFPDDLLAALTAALHAAHQAGRAGRPL